jgi:uncharacterized protein (DUF433 family)
VKDVLKLLANGASWQEIIADHAFLEEDDIRTRLEFRTSDQSRGTACIVRRSLVDDPR